MRRTALVLTVALVVVLASVSVSEASFWEVESQAQEKLTPAPAPAPAHAVGAEIDCGKECSRRCSKTWRRKACLHFCGMCCNKCRCVPSGFAGNKDECPCYRDWKNRKGRDKCP